MRSLILKHEGFAILVALSAAPIRKRILEYPLDDVDLFTVISCPFEDDSLTPSFDNTISFARTWAMELATRDTLEQHIASAPAFVVLHARDDLVTWWQRRTAEIDQNFVPVTLKSARAA